MTAEDIINQFYILLNNGNLSATDIANIYYNIIFTKNAESRTDIYIDCKHFLKNYLQSVDEMNFGYDHLDTTKIIQLVHLLKAEEQISIWKYLKKQCLKFQCDEYWSTFEPHYYVSKNEHLKSGKRWYLNPLKLCKFIYFRTIYSYLDLLFFIAAVIAIDIIILLPNTSSFPSLFEVKYAKLSHSFYKNHILNVIMNLMEFDIDFQVTPLNFTGALILLGSKIIKVIFVVNFLVDKLIKKITFDE